MDDRLFFDVLCYSQLNRLKCVVCESLFSPRSLIGYHEGAEGDESANRRED